MFEQYPKIRLELPNEYRAIYAKYYRENREGRTKLCSLIQNNIESWMHKKVASDVKDVNRETSTLEIGAGTLNHLLYERNTRPYDIVEPFKELFTSLDWSNRIRNVYYDISEIPIEQKYERIISIASLEHIVDLPSVVAKAGLLLAKEGRFRIGIPSEGTLLWYLGWRLTTGLEFKLRYNLDYGVFMRYEHVNTADEIEEVLNYFFVSVRCQVFGLSKYLSMYRFYDCSNPYKQYCLKFI